MYKSPIEIIQGQMTTAFDGEILKSVQKVGINVDKTELLKALAYDRGQYDKGYKDGYRTCEIELSERLGVDVNYMVQQKRAEQTEPRAETMSCQECKWWFTDDGKDGYCQRQYHNEECKYEPITDCPWK